MSVGAPNSGAGRPKTRAGTHPLARNGRGARGWSGSPPLVFGTLLLSLLVAWKQFHGPVTETTLVQADTGRQLAAARVFPRWSTIRRRPRFSKSAGPASIRTGRIRSCTRRRCIRW